MSYAPTPYGLNGRPRPAFGRAGARALPQRPAQTARVMASAPEPRTDERPAEAFYADGSFGIGRVFARAIGVLKSDFVTFFALVALFAIPERLVYHAVPGAAGALIGTLTLSACGFGLQLAVIHLALRRYAGAPAGFAGCAVKALAAFIPAALIVFLSGIATAAAALLLIVPGFMVMLAWSLILPAWLSGDAGLFAGFGRSRALTKGHRWKILAVLLLLGAMLGVMAGLLMPIWGIHGALGAISFFSQNWLMKLVFNAAFGLLLAAMYHELAGAKEADAF